jgi:hypothetical protein
MNRVRRAVSCVGSVAALVALEQVAFVVGASPASAVQVQSSSIQIRQTWSVPIHDFGAPVAESSPTVATLDNRGPAVLVGDRAGHIYALRGASNTNEVLALNPGCGLAWKSTLDGVTTSSPALVDALGNHGLQVAEGTNVAGALSAVRCGY